MEHKGRAHWRERKHRRAAKTDPEAKALKEVAVLHGSDRMRML